MTHRLVLGKHSGTCAVIKAYADMGIVLSQGEAQMILSKVREFSYRTKHSPEHDDLQQIYFEAVPYTAVHS